MVQERSGPQRLTDIAVLMNGSAGALPSRAIATIREASMCQKLSASGEIVWYQMAGDPTEALELSLGGSGNQRLSMMNAEGSRDR